MYNNNLRIPVITDGGVVVLRRLSLRCLKTCQQRPLAYALVCISFYSFFELTCLDQFSLFGAT